MSIRGILRGRLRPKGRGNVSGSRRRIGLLCEGVRGRGVICGWVINRLVVVSFFILFFFVVYYCGQSFFNYAHSQVFVHSYFNNHYITH